MEIGYVRTSTDEINPNNQINIIREESRNPNIIIFKDISVSGFKVKALERDGFKSMLNFIKSNPVSKIYTFEVSRFGRTWEETYEAIKTVEETGAMLISLSPAETFLKIEDKSLRSLLLHILAWIAQREHENMHERSIIGIKRYIEENGRWGREKIEIDWKKVKKLYEEGRTWTEIARIMKVSSTTLNKQKFEHGFERDTRGRKIGD